MYRGRLLHGFEEIILPRWSSLTEFCIIAKGPTLLIITTPGLSNNLMFLSSSTWGGGVRAAKVKASHQPSSVDLSQAGVWCELGTCVTGYVTRTSWMFLVTPGIAPTVQLLFLSRELMRELFPTLGRPTTPTLIDVRKPLLRV